MDGLHHILWKDDPTLENSTLLRRHLVKSCPHLLILIFHSENNYPLARDSNKSETRHFTPKYKHCNRITQKKRHHSSHQSQPIHPHSPPNATLLGWGGKDVSISSLRVQKMLPAHWIKVPKWQLSTLILTDPLRH